MHTSSTHLLTAAFGPALKRCSTLPPTFLIPSLTTAISSKASFSSTPAPSARKDGNPRRGVSALRRKGPKRIERLNELLSRIPGAEVPPELHPRDYTKQQPKEIEYLSPATKRARLNAAIAASLPKPVLNPAERSKVEVDPDHGLWEFFNEERTALTTPLDLSNHGRAWTVAELRNKDWEDLWRLWWVCVKERNRLESFRLEKERVGGHMYGDYEVEGRGEAVKTTMKRIKHTLTERWYSWENARQAAMDDEEVDLYADSEKGQLAYIPREIEVDEEMPAAAAAEQSVEDVPRKGWPVLPKSSPGGGEARV